VRGGAILALWNMRCERVVFLVPLKMNRVLLRNFLCCNCGVMFGSEFGRSGI
jgi:hypothetical protein